MANEKRLIDANKLTEGIESRLRNDAIIEWLCGIIADAPTVDAVEVVHGRWLYSHTEAFTEECSQCGFCVPWDDGMLHEYNYCPNCGADMR